MPMCEAPWSACGSTPLSLPLTRQRSLMRRDESRRAKAASSRTHSKVLRTAIFIRAAVSDPAAEDRGKSAGYVTKNVETPGARRALLRGSEHFKLSHDRILSDFVNGGGAAGLTQLSQLRTILSKI